MKIAGVSVNTKCLPNKKQLIKSALTSKEYAYKRNALELINIEIDKSELYRKSPKKAKSTAKQYNKDSRGLSDSKQSEHNKDC